MTNFPIVSAFIFPLINHARQIEMLFGEYLNDPEPGIYSNNSAELVLPACEKFFTNGKDKDGAVVYFEVKQVADIRGDVFNSNGEIVVPFILSSLLRDQPTIPVVAIALVNAYIEKIILDRSIYSNRKSDQLNYVWRKQIKEEWLLSFELMDSIETALFDLRIEIVKFMGKDNWIMHFFTSKFCDGRIEKSIDYRIWDWEERKRQGEIKLENSSFDIHNSR